MATMGDARFGQWAQPGFGASLSQSSPSSPGVLPSPDSTPTSASSAFNSPGVDPSPGQDHFQQAGLSGGSWSPGSSNDGSVFLAEGGPVPDQTQDSGNAAPPQADPFALVQQALTYGRQKLGLPQSFFGGSSDTGNAPAPEAPSQSFAEGGVVEDADGDSDGDQGAQSDQGVIPTGNTDQEDQGSQGEMTPSGNTQGPDPKAAMAYLQGAGAMPADQAMALERSVDPHGTMDPNVRKMEAVKATGTPDKAFGLMQHYRQKFNAYNAFAQTAAKGSPQKPADMNASARAATQAYQHLPDGNDIRFNPVQGGMHVVVRNVVEKSQPKKFAGGGVVDVDYETAGAKPWASDPHSIQQQEQAVADGGAQTEPGSPDEDPAAAAYQHGQTGVLDMQYDPSQDPMGAGQSVEGEGKDSVGSAGEAARKGLQAAGGAIAKGAKAAYNSQDMGSAARKVQEFVLSIPQYLGWLAKEGQADSVMEKGADKSLAAMASSGQTMGQARPMQDNPPDPTEQDQGDQGENAQAQGQPQPQGALPSYMNQQGHQGLERDRAQYAQTNPQQPQAQGQQPQNGGTPDAGGLRPTPNNAEQFGSTVGKNGGESGSSLADVLHEIDQAYPFVGMSQQRALARAAARQHWSDNRTKIEAEQTKGANMDRRAHIVGDYKAVETKTKVDAKHEDVGTQAGAHIQGIAAQQAGAGQRNENSNATKEKVADRKEGGVESRFVRSEFGKNGRAVAMNQPSAIGNDKKMAEGIKSLGGAPQPAPNKPQGPHSAAARKGTGPAPTSVPPPGMKYQENADKTQWRLVPAQ